MKQAIIYTFICLFMVVSTWESQQQYWMEEDDVPEEAIRLRIFSHSDALVHQQIKRDVRDEVALYTREMLEDTNTKHEAREVFEKELGNLEQLAVTVVENHGYDLPVDVSLDTDVEFPTKVYGPLVYPAGLYEALVIEIGEGNGENWWCVLFPPLCLTDLGIGTDDEEEELSTEGVNNSEDNEEPEFRFFVVDLWEDWFGEKS
ncbi:stage II sporulation protein R [Geomicrobium sp. JCM 19039]|uniref:stage II sporulation protein R n=1 Tax=Geomicrobium sp. JCM 19039 TaxID=1460636 RepID=UPI00045F15BF|nr:stage II sporulation protein R [Geomicrobium sp. JCM 19039]GAK14472.1 stage II sporulation protein [Geomicrobium sp. JCM 19039]